MVYQDESALLASIRAANAVEVEPEVEELAARYGREFTPRCIQPWELMEAPRFDLLAPARQKHVESCFMCAVTFNHAPALQTLAAAAAAEARAWEPVVTTEPTRAVPTVPVPEARRTFREIFAAAYRRVKRSLPRWRSATKPSKAPDNRQLARP